MRHLAMSVAAVALAAAGSLSAQGNGNAKGNGDKRGAPHAAAQNGNVKAGKAERSPAAKPGNGNERAVVERIDRRNERNNGKIGKGNEGNGKAESERRESDLERFIGAAPNGAKTRYGRTGQGLIEGCPPGLAKKRNGCSPPGQAREQRSPLGGVYSPGLFGYSNYGDGRYFYDDGYLMRLGSDGGIASWLPLLGGALGIGSVWPDTYRSYEAPDYYVDYYGLGGQDGYRYADNVIYRVDPETTAIQSIAALLTGDDFTVGQPVPRGYDVYNVPYTYRESYYDTPDANYRYSDGYVYRIDPKTKLVAEAIDLLI